MDDATQDDSDSRRHSRRLSRRIKKLAHASFSLTDAKQLMKSLKEKLGTKDDMIPEEEESSAPPSPIVASLDLSETPTFSSTSSEDLSSEPYPAPSLSHTALFHLSTRDIKKSKMASRTLHISKIKGGLMQSKRQNSDLRYTNSIITNNNSSNNNNDLSASSSSSSTLTNSRSKRFHFTTLRPSGSLSPSSSQSSILISEASPQVDLSTPRRTNSLGGEPSAISVSSSQYFNKQSSIPDPYNDHSALYVVANENNKDCIIGGSLQQLLNALTDERADAQYVEDFLFTYRYFTTAEKLLEHFTYRYLFLAPAESTAEEQALYNDWRGPIQLRVVNCMKKWLVHHFEDFERNEQLLQRVKSFIKVTVTPQNEKWAQKLLELIHDNIVTAINEGGAVTPKIGLHSADVLAALLKNSGLVSNRTWRLTKYKQCFVGQDAVDWMMKQMGLDSRQAACDLGAKLINSNLITCVSKDKNAFRDTAHSFYQFTKLENGKKTPTSSPPPSEANSPNLAHSDKINGHGPNHANSGSDASESGNVNVTINNFSLSTSDIYNSVNEDLAGDFPVSVPPLLPRKGLPLHVLTIHHKEMARQLTLIEFDIYKLITVRELSHQKWNKNGGTESPHINAMINRFNEVGFWIATEIVNTFSLPHRINILKRFIKVAHSCKKFNNFNTMMEIAVGLNMGAITRLTKTWQGIDPKTKSRFDAIMELTQSTSNYKNYRELLKSCGLPVLPYLGLHLRDLTFIEDGNPDQLMDNVINFHKMRMLSKVFSNIATYQKNKFKFTKVPEIQLFLLQGVLIERSDSQLYKASYECEPSRTANKDK